MATNKQRNANRRNAQKSTGPRTAEGKDRIRLNGIKHGLCSQQALLPGEDLEAFNQLRQSFFDHYQPVGPMELFCLEKMIVTMWRLRRLGGMEADLFRWHFPRANDEAVNLDDYNKQWGPNAPGPLGRAFEAAGRLNAGGSDAFSRIARYESHLDRAFYKAEAKLEELQSARGETALEPAEAGEPVLPPPPPPPTPPTPQPPEKPEPQPEPAPQPELAQPDPALSPNEDRT